MRVARYVVTGLLLGAVAAFVGELLRPRHRHPVVVASGVPPTG
ncbi:MAG: hypothetical protein ACLGIV_04420 [Actinomycetes bacterium]